MFVSVEEWDDTVVSVVIALVVEAGGKEVETVLKISAVLID